MAGSPQAHEGGIDGFAAAQDKEKASQLKRRLKDQQQDRQEDEQRRRAEELQLVEEYKQFLEQEKISKKEATQARLNKLKAQAELHAKRAEAKARAKGPSPAASQGAAALGDDSAETTCGKEIAAHATATKSPRGSSPLKSPGSKSLRRDSADIPVSKSQRRDSADAESVDARVAKINQSRGFRRMLDALERRDAAALLNKKLQPLQQEPQDQEEDPDSMRLYESAFKGKEIIARTSQHQLARRHRLLTMQQVATEVLKSKKQLAGCFQEGARVSAMMGFS